MNTYEIFWNDLKWILEKNHENNNDLLIAQINSLLKEKFNQNIIVELSHHNWKRELIFSGEHDTNKINIIKNIMRYKIKFDKYIFIWPKPWLWFDFILNIDNQNIDASMMTFYPLKKDWLKNLGISLNIKGIDNINREILWKIIETGIWDENASKISYVTYTNIYDSDYMEINMLWDYINWYSMN